MGLSVVRFSLVKTFSRVGKSSFPDSIETSGKNLYREGLKLGLACTRNGCGC